MVLKFVCIIISVSCYMYAHQENAKYFIWDMDGEHKSRSELRIMKVVAAALFIISLASLLYPYLVD